MIYIHKNLRYQLKKDLNIFKPKATESAFIEVINDKRLNTIIGCIYKHPKKNSQWIYKWIYASHTKKEIMLMGDLNINLLHSDVNKETPRLHG